MIQLSLETKNLTALAYDPLSYIRIFTLQKVLKFGNKTLTLDKFFVSNQPKIIAFFLSSESNAKFVIFCVPYNPAMVYELKHQITFTDNFNLNLLDELFTVFFY